MKAIIPCAGYGTRMNMQPNESKEMLLDQTGQPIIDYALNLCGIYGLDPIIILRKEKTDLRDYIVQRRLSFTTIEPCGEWNDTVLTTKSMWAEDNILILPDTRFEPVDAIGDIKKALDLGAKCALAVHTVSDPGKWGIIAGYEMMDKPPLSSGPQHAWGLIGFKRWFGEQLFTNVKQGTVLEDASFTFLRSFKDITREGKLQGD